ncbi:MAG: DUF3137 domain-containing protein [Pseudomonadota bacterium]
MAVQPPSDRADFDGFADFYDRILQPYLVGKENARARAVKLFGVTLMAAAAVVLGLLTYGPWPGANHEIATAVGFGGFFLSSFILSRVRGEITHGLLARICEGLALDYARKARRPRYVETLQQHGLLPSFNKEEWEDRVAGIRNGAGFELCEGQLKVVRNSGRRRTERTVFHGQLIAIAYPSEFYGETVLRRDRGVFNRFTKPGDGFAQVGLASPAFEKAFEAWSTDQVEARALLDPIVLERFQELERLFEGKALRAAFVDGELLLAIETGDRLNMGSMFKRLDDPARVETILKEFDLVFDLIDVLIKRFDQPIDGPVTAEALRA